jgi:hypothetical protein
VIAAAAVGSNHGDGRGEPPPGWLGGAWVATWGLGAVFQLLPGQNTAASVADAVTESAAAGPAWLGDAGSHLAGAIDSHPWVVVALVVVQAAIAAAAAVAVDGAARQASLVAGAALAIGFWCSAKGSASCRAVRRPIPTARRCSCCSQSPWLRRHSARARR